jgi:hypothetical protein
MRLRLGYALLVDDEMSSTTPRITQSQPLPTPQASRDGTDRPFAPLSPGFDAGDAGENPWRHQSASGPAFQLPGADVHRQATTRLRLEFTLRNEGIKHLHDHPPLVGSTCRIWKP